MKPLRPIYRKPRRKPLKPEKTVFKPRASRQLAATLAQIGIPESQPFVPDPFQLEALDKLQDSDVLVSAPTGSGKTWIAQKAIERCLHSQQRVWYASPLKALSNAKLVEFSRIFGDENVGILTGDRKENTGAPLMVGTTEILRNQLYDAMYQGQDLPIGLVILDEAHYLGDQDRGVVWEEVLIYMPGRIRLLLLSATIANSGQIAAWLEHIRASACQVVYSKTRPVPLVPLFLFPDGQLTPLQNSKGTLLPAIRSFARGQRPGHPSISNAVNALQELNLLPAIFFLKSRVDCEKALNLAAQSQLNIDNQCRTLLKSIVDDFLTRFPFLARQEGITCLLSHHLAVHHAGLLPHWKLLVEELMQQGLLKAIFSTSTVAAGVNFPARTVVINQSDRFDGQEFSKLGSSELTQMTGRAGRRGMDKIGFALLLPGPFQDLEYMACLFKAPPEPIKSQLNINFSMVLNLLLSHRPQDIKQLLELSLAAWQADKNSRPDKKISTIRQQVATLLDKADCGTAAEVVVRGDLLRLLLQKAQVARQQLWEPPASLGRWQALSRGRVFVSMRMLPFAVLRKDDNPHNPGVWAVGLLPEKRLRRGYPRIEFVAQEDIYKLYAEVISLPNEDNGRGLARALNGFEWGRQKELNAQQLKRLAKKANQTLQERQAAIQQSLQKIPCHSCLQQTACENRFSELTILARKLTGHQRTAADVLWFEFIRHLEFLRSEGYVNVDGTLSHDGYWASSLRLSQPLLIAEAIRRSALPTRQPALLAALLALLADNREMRDNSVAITPQLQKACHQLIDILQPLLKRLHEWGFMIPPLPLNAAAAMYAWGEMADLNTVSEIYGAGEGDVAQLIFRVADNLRQLTGLNATHPELARSAHQAAELLIRPPILLPT